MQGQRWAVRVAVLASACLMLAGCTATGDVDAPKPTSSTTAKPSASAEPKPDPTLLPGGTALANLEFFDFVNERLLASNSQPLGRDIIDNLVNAGFDKSAMQVTPDKTSELRRPVDSIEFSVRVHDECLIGQFAAGAFHSLIGPVLNDGACLIGKTRPIDW